ncbi:hypothetical protein I7I48_03855 [Histoplasma ohiense]|nr:hypothetical protein I7I48_03855 [Histoplasma ohiense (nom. inval.)]
MHRPSTSFNYTREFSFSRPGAYHAPPLGKTEPPPFEPVENRRVVFASQGNQRDVDVDGSWTARQQDERFFQVASEVRVVSFGERPVRLQIVALVGQLGMEMVGLGASNSGWKVEARTGFER